MPFLKNTTIDLALTEKHSNRMKDSDVEELLKDGKGYNLNLSHVLEFLMARTIANSFLSSEILRRQIELEQLIKNGSVEKEKVTQEFTELCRQLSDNATTEKNNVINELFFLNKEARKITLWL